MRLCGSKPPGEALPVVHHFRRDDALSRPDPADAAHPLLAAKDLILDQQPLLAVLVNDELLGPGRGSPSPYSHSRASEAPGYAIGIDDVVSTGRELLLLAQLGLSWGSVVNPVFLETSIAIALARHLQPAGQQPRRREKQAIAHVGRIVSVLLEGRDRDLLVVRIVLKPASRQRC